MTAASLLDSLVWEELYARAARALAEILDLTSSSIADCAPERGLDVASLNAAGASETLVEVVSLSFMATLSWEVDGFLARLGSKIPPEKKKKTVL